MMPQGHLGRADLIGKGVQGATAQARTQRAGGFAFRDQFLDHRVSVFFNDVIFHAQRLEVGRQHVFGETRLLLVHVYRHDLELDRRHFLQVQQHIEQGVAVLAARQAHHHLVAMLNHVEVGNCLTGQSTQAFLEFDLRDRVSAHSASIPRVKTKSR